MRAGITAVDFAASALLEADTDAAFTVRAGARSGLGPARMSNYSGTRVVLKRCELRFLRHLLLLLKS